MMTHLQAINHFRSIWISDVHLGTRGCKAEFLLDFLRHTESDAEMNSSAMKFVPSDFRQGLCSSYRKNEGWRLLKMN